MTAKKAAKKTAAKPAKKAAKKAAAKPAKKAAKPAKKAAAKPAKKAAEKAPAKVESKPVPQAAQAELVGLDEMAALVKMPVPKFMLLIRTGRVQGVKIEGEWRFNPKLVQQTLGRRSRGR